MRVGANVVHIGKKFNMPHLVCRELDMVFNREKERVIKGVLFLRVHLDFRLVVGNFYTEFIVSSGQCQFDFVIEESFLNEIVV